MLIFCLFLKKYKSFPLSDCYGGELIIYNSRRVGLSWCWATTSIRLSVFVISLPLISYIAVTLLIFSDFDMEGSWTTTLSIFDSPLDSVPSGFQNPKAIRDAWDYMITLCLPASLPLPLFKMWRQIGEYSVKWFVLVFGLHF